MDPENNTEPIQVIPETPASSPFDEGAELDGLMTSMKRLNMVRMAFRILFEAIIVIAIIMIIRSRY